MKDFIVGNSIQNVNIEASKTKKSSFDIAKKEYDSFVKKNLKSDLRNSPMMKQKELELLLSLKTLAEKEARLDDIAWIDNKIGELGDKPSENVLHPSSIYYTPASFRGSRAEENYFKGVLGQTSALDSLKNDEGVLDENMSKIIKAFEESEFGIDSIAYMLKKCRDDDGKLLDEMVPSLEILAKSGVNPTYIAQLLDESQRETSDFGIGLDLCQKVADFKSAGIEDIQAVKFAKFLDLGFKDEALIKSFIIKMVNTGISAESITKILDELSVKDVETGERVVSQHSVNAIVSLKKTMSLTRANEKKERDNPINHLGVTIFTSGDNVMVFKDNKVTYHTPVEGANIYNMKKDYEELVSNLEDNLLFDFSKKYKNEDGEIDSKYSRTFTQLRRVGITYDQLINMTDFCIDDGKINTDKLKAIEKLKTNGVLAVDVLPILSVINKTENGTYSDEDISNACDLTSTVLGGKEVVSLLPAVNGKENVKEFFMDFSRIFEKKHNVPALLPMITTSDGRFDENSMDLLYSLAQNFFVSTVPPMNETDFMSNVSDILSAAKNKDEEFIEDDAAGICSILCQNKETPENIIRILEKAKTIDGKVDEKLAEIVWDMSLQKASCSDIEFLLGFCRDDNGKVNSVMTDNVLSMFESGLSKDDIIMFVLNMFYS